MKHEAIFHGAGEFLKLFLRKVQSNIDGTFANNLATTDWLKLSSAFDPEIVGRVDLCYAEKLGQTSCFMVLDSRSGRFDDGSKVAYAGIWWNDAK